MQRKGGAQMRGSTDDMSTFIVVNPMTKWLHSYGFWALYITMIAVTRLVLWVLISSPAEGWTVTCVAHCALSYVLLHTLKGAPIGDLSIRGKYDHLTFWEQIDDEYHGTFVRKAFSSVPIILLVISLNWVRNDWHLLPWILMSTLACVIPKLPMMHKKHIFGDDASPPPSPR
eukprot:TRINITY_DN29243_c0_g2_i1.p1 TRINITY_DN29243_c0_g2~~TRINITY_DN29243_c0_g2_i1.p1  ORF type:complete len:172 (+),score=63.75 TRINITY_DN29243_c0_g2_i1:222-737(+)